MSEPLRELERLVGAPLPDAVRGLKPEQIATLTAAVETALLRQQADLAAAIDDGLGFVPRMLRGVVKKTVFG